MDLCSSFPQEVAMTEAQRYKTNEQTTNRVASKENSHHFALLGEHTAVLWRDSRMTDITVIVRNNEFAAHKSVLTCYSPYFRNLLMEPERKMIRKIKIKGTTPEAFGILLKYMYSGELDVTCQNLADVYRGSRKLEMCDVTEKCQLMLTKPASDPTNLLYVYVTGKRLGLRQTWQRALTSMKKRFEEVISTKDFLELNVEQLCELMSADVIGARSEIPVYLAALKWLQRDYLQREQFISQVMENVRFSLMTLEEIVACYHPPLLPGIVEHPAVRNCLTDATCYVSAKMCGQADKFGSYNCVPRTYLLEGQPIELWDTSGFDTGLIGESKENIAANKIQSFYKTYLKRKSSSCERAIKGKETSLVIQAWCRGYLTRKSFSKLHTKSTKRLNRHSTKHYEDQLADVTPSKVDLLTTDPCLRFALINRPSKHECFSYSSKLLGNVRGSIQSKSSPVLLMMGGMNPQKLEIPEANIMLRYHPQENKWERCGEMPEPIHHLCAVCIEDNVYCIGGCNIRENVKDRMVATPHCYRFHYKEIKWYRTKSMHHARIYHGVAVLFGRIYAVGGKNERGDLLSSVECYVTEKDAWYELKRHLHCPRMGMGVAAYEGMIWVAGGMVQPSEKERIFIIKDVECYDPKARLWIRSKPKLPSPMYLITLVQHQKKLYLIGGSGIQERNFCSVTDVYCYNEDENTWQTISPLQFPRHGVAATTTDSTLYVIGGLSSLHNRAVDDTVRLDDSNKSWISCKPLPSPLCGAAVVTLPTLKD